MSRSDVGRVDVRCHVDRPTLVVRVHPDLWVLLRLCVYLKGLFPEVPLI